MDQLGMGLLLNYQAHENAGRLRGEPARRTSPRVRASLRLRLLRARRP